MSGDTLRLALTRGELVLHYQPVFDLETGVVHSFEALLRWEHPQRGLISPDAFIPIAEEHGMIGEIGTRALNAACLQLAEWNAEFPFARRVRMAVNVSAHQLDDDFVATVAEVLRATDVGPAQLTLELTESALIDPDCCLQIVDGLRDLGVGIAIDDFGTGYSSLRYIERLPHDYIKLDGSFVHGLGASPRSSVVAEAVIHMARALGLRVVAERVESPEQARRLRELGCDLAQGYLFALPLPAEGAERLLVTGRGTACGVSTRRSRRFAREAQPAGCVTG